MRDTSVSVLTVVKDPHEPQLMATVDSVACQTHGDVQYVVVDGGTSGAGERAARRYARTDGLVLICGPDRGIYDAMNKAVERASGRYLLFLNAADTLVPHALQRWVACARDAPDSAIVYCDYWFGSKAARAPEHLNGAFDFYNMGVAHQAVIIPRCHFARLGPYRTEFRIVSDHLWLRDARDAEVAFVHLPERLVHIDDSGSSSCATPAGLARFEREASVRVMMRFPFVPREVARAMFRLRRDVTVLPRIEAWLADAAPEAAGHPSWPRFVAGLAAYVEDVLVRCHGRPGTRPRA
jgi:glycosyltransferase involved in cell wall biosynthesis